MLFRSIIAGITGASITTASAYIADISNDENRPKNFGMIGAAFGLGFIIGPVLGGLLGAYGSRVPFYAAAVLCFLNFLYGYFVLPESLPKEKRRPFEWKRANPVGSLHFLTKYPTLSRLVVALILIQIALHAVQSNWSYFVMVLDLDLTMLTPAEIQDKHTNQALQLLIVLITGAAFAGMSITIREPAGA